MMWIVQFFQKRPSDTTIRVLRVLFGLIIGLLLGLNFNDFTLALPFLAKPYELYVRYSLFIFALFPIFSGIANVCLLKRKYVKWMQFLVGIALIIIGNMIVMNGLPPETPNAPTTTASGNVNFQDLVGQANKSTPMDVGFWLSLLSIFPMLAGITGKTITSNCLKHGEVITKIRV